jgi:hypothetical protein
LCRASRIAVSTYQAGVLEPVGVEQRLVNLPALLVAHLGERWVADHLLDAAA